MSGCLVFAIKAATTDWGRGGAEARSDSRGPRPDGQNGGFNQVPNYCSAAEVGCPHPRYVRKTRRDGQGGESKKI